MLILFELLKISSVQKEIFSLRQTDRLVREKYKLNLNEVSFSCKTLTLFDPKTWNSLPYHIKPAENICSFNTIIRFWDGENCSCKICSKK